MNTREEMITELHRAFDALDKARRLCGQLRGQGFDESDMIRIGQLQSDVALVNGQFSIRI